MKKLLSATIVLVLMVVGFSCCSDYRESRLKDEGEEIVAKIESFHKDAGRLPNSLSEIGIEEKEEGPIYYKKESDSKYIVWFGTGLGESVTYESDTKRWKP